MNNIKINNKIIIREEEEGKIHTYKYIYTYIYL